MTRDARLIYAAALVRATTVSLVGVTLAIHLAAVGFSTTQIGLLIGVGLAGSSLATVVVGLRGDAWGRRRVLIALALLNAGGYLALAAFSGVGVLIPLAFAGMLNGMGRDRGPNRRSIRRSCRRRFRMSGAHGRSPGTTWSWTPVMRSARWRPRSPRS
jgi:MFS family permease